MQVVHRSGQGGAIPKEAVASETTGTSDSEEAVASETTGASEAVLPSTAFMPKEVASETTGTERRRKRRCPLRIRAPTQPTQRVATASPLQI